MSVPIIDFQEFVVSRDLPNILASRYASSAMVDIWTPSGKVVLERECWLAVLEAQGGLSFHQTGHPVQMYRPPEVMKGRVVQAFVPCS